MYHPAKADGQSGMPLVTIITPVYNIKKYLELCLESLLAQTYSNIEVIVVDDGSTDGSDSVCDEYASRDQRVISLHKQNGGQAEARNIALRYAHGDYVLFVDGDDFVSPFHVEILVRAAMKTSASIVAIPGGVSFQGSEVPALISRDEANACDAVIISEYDYQKSMLYQAMSDGTQWRLYSREIIPSEAFPVGIYYEDLASTHKMVHRSGSVAFVDRWDLYAYRVRMDSTIHQEFRPIKAKSALQVSEELYHDISHWYPGLSTAASSRCFSVCRMVFAQMPSVNSGAGEVGRFRKDLWCVLKSHRMVVLRDPAARKRERLAAAIACLGELPFTFFCKIARKMGLLR